MRVLFVCSGNICRSPLGAQVLTARLGPDAAAFVVESAGTIADDGAAMDGAAAAQSVRLGGDPSGHGSRYLTAAIVEDADLVLTAERSHRAAVVSLAPRATKRAFTIKQFARVLGGSSPVTWPTCTRPRTWSNGSHGCAVPSRRRPNPPPTTSTTPTAGPRRPTLGSPTRSTPRSRPSPTPSGPRCADAALR
ncbi:arsenate reductase/protein-tyrosine-phosphatase family protein [Curtobacterium sp. 24E2]|nr:hypothetical protein JN350_05645 [Curtobacterium sp. 24E2]